MTDQQATAGKTTFVVPADLAPADAEVVRVAALSAIDKAKADDGHLFLELNGDRPSPCATQILVATTRSASAASVELSYSAAADKTLTELGIN